MPGDNFFQVSVSELPLYWYECASLVQQALDAVECYQTLDSVYDALASGRQQLWLMSGHGIMITQISQAPKAKVCFILYCAGKNIEAMLDKTDESIVKWAKEQGCSVVAVAGRFGWLKKLKFKGYRPTGITLEREI